MNSDFLPAAPKPHWIINEIFDSSKTIEPLIMENYEIGMHSQEFYEINIILTGHGKHYINNGSVNVYPGHTFIIPPMVKHGYTGGKGFNVFHLLISPVFWNRHAADFQPIPSFYTIFNIEPMMRAKQNAIPSLILSSEQLNAIQNLTAQLLQYSKNHTPFNSLLIDSTTVILITKLCMIYNENENAPAQDDSFIKSLSLIYHGYREKITIERLAGIALLSRTAYIKRFSDTFGTPPIQFLNNHRVTVAKTLLHDTNYSLEQIASLTGFYDAPHFIRCFKNLEGYSPTQYRKLK